MHVYVQYLWHGKVVKKYLTSKTLCTQWPFIGEKNYQIVDEMLQF